MINQFTPKVSEILSFSKEEAERLNSSEVRPEHILLGILRDTGDAVSEILAHLHIDKKELKERLESSVKTLDANATLHLEHTQDMALSEQSNNILRLSILEARIRRTLSVEVYHLFLAILHDKSNNTAKDALNALGVDYDKAVAIENNKKSEDHRLPINEGFDLPDDDDDDEETSFFSQHRSDKGKASSSVNTKSIKSKTPILDNFGTDFTQLASQGKLDPVVGREKEIMRVSEILGRRKKNNPILIGEPGVGKSAIVEGLAQMIVKHLTSPLLFSKRVISLDLSGLVAGTKYRGQFEERVRALVREIEQNDVIVFIDEIHTIVGAGSTPGSMDAANMLKPALARGTIQCIGATTLDEYRNSIEKDGALERRFQKVLVEPTTEEETLQILHNIKDRYEAHHQVTYTDEVLQACVSLTQRYITDRSFPDKAIDALDEVGSHIHLQHAEMPQEIIDLQKELESVKSKKQLAVKNQNFELAAGYRDKQTELEAQLKQQESQWTNGNKADRVTITVKNVADVVSMMTGIPVQRMQEAENAQLKSLASDLKAKVIAQDRAIDKVVRAIQRNRVGLKDPNHPIGAFMFLGPTGVGKTYLAKKLAERMFGSSDALIRIDMSEYTESFNTSRLVGAPPGYVGYEEGGQLTERVRRHPYSIVLLDEIEKAHGNVFNMLLQVLDEGRLTDGNGRLVDFRNTVIIMTSNAGTRQLKDFGRGVGFNAGSAQSFAQDEKDKEYARSIIQKSLSKQFAPEFLNRLDEIITFDQLDLAAITQIVDLELAGLNRRIDDLGFHLQVTDAAKEFVAKKGYDVQFGARPLKRAIQTYIEDLVCENILSGEYTQGDTMLVDKESEADKLHCTKSVAQ